MSKAEIDHLPPFKRELLIYLFILKFKVLLTVQKIKSKAIICVDTIKDAVDVSVQLILTSKFYCERFWA